MWTWTADTGDQGVSLSGVLSVPRAPAPQSVRRRQRLRQPRGVTARGQWASGSAFWPRGRCAGSAVVMPSRCPDEGPEDGCCAGLGSTAGSSLHPACFSFHPMAPLLSRGDGEGAMSTKESSRRAYARSERLRPVRRHGSRSELQQRRRLGAAMYPPVTTSEASSAPGSDGLNRIGGCSAVLVGVRAGWSPGALG